MLNAVTPVLSTVIGTALGPLLDLLGLQLGSATVTADALTVEQPQVFYKN